MIKIILGDEPYMVDCMVHKFSKLECPELNLMKTSSFGEEENLFLSAYPILDAHRVLVIEAKKLGELDCPYFKDCIDMETDNVIIVKSFEYDGRTSFYKELVKKGFVVSCGKKDFANSIVPILSKRASSLNVKVDEGVFEEMVKRVGYLENNDVNMYTLMGYFNTMVALSKHITHVDMESVVPAYCQDNIFGIAKLICSRDVKGLKKQAEMLRGSEIETLSALLREFRISYKAKYFPIKEIGVTYSAFLKRDKQFLVDGISIITDTIAGIKKGTVITRDCLMDVFLRLLYVGGVK